MSFCTVLRLLHEAIASCSHKKIGQSEGHRGSRPLGDFTPRQVGSGQCCWIVVGRFHQVKGGKKHFDSQVQSYIAILALRLFISLMALLAISVLGVMSVLSPVE